MGRTLLPLAGLVLFTLFGCASAASHYERGDISYMHGNYTAALSEYRAAKRKDPALEGIDQKIRVTEIRLYLQRGDEAVQRRRWAAAEQAYQEVRYLDPDNPDVPERLRRLTTARAEDHFQRGQDLLARGNPFEAIGEFEQAVAFDPEHPRAARELQRARDQEQERRVRAEDAYQDGRLAETEGRQEEALEHFARALEIDPHHSEAARELDRVRRRMGAELAREGDELMAERRWSEALATYRQAREHDRNLPGIQQRMLRAKHEARAEVLVQEGQHAFDQGDWHTAYERFHAARELTSERESFRLRYETAREQLAASTYASAQSDELGGRIEAALAGYESIEAYYPGYRDIPTCRDRVRARLRAARESYQAGCRAHEARDLVHALEHFRTCALAVPDFRDLRHRQRELRAEIDTAEQFYRRADAAQTAGDHERARVLFEECLSIATPFHDATERLTHLLDPRSGELSQSYQQARRAHAARDLFRAREFYRACRELRPGYRDVAERLVEVRTALAGAHAVLQRAHAAHERCDLERARELYEECLALCSPFEAARQELEAVLEAMQTLAQARRLERERRLVPAREHYGRILEHFRAHAGALRRAQEIDATLGEIRPLYAAMVAADGSHEYRLALSHAREIRALCVGYEDVDQSIPRLESEVDYLDARALERSLQYEEAGRLFRRCAERTPGFRDVESRLRRSDH